MAEGLKEETKQAATKDGASAAASPYRLYLREDQIPKQWYNLRADMPEPPEPMRLPNGQVATFDDISPVFCDELVKQELDDETAYFDIPEGVQEMYKVYRPSPLCRAYNLERYLDTPAKIYYKFEGNNTSGSHKLNSALAQAYYAKQQGLDKITTETGAGQWGTALAEAADHYDVNLDVFMVKCSYQQKPFRRSIMRTFNATITPSPSDTTEIGRKMLSEHPDSTGSLGTAISEAVERAMNVPGNKGRYQLGSVLNQVVLHQSVIGLESYTAFEELGEYPDIVIGCAGGGSNLAGLIAPFMREKLKGNKPDTRFIAVEPASCPSLTRGRYAYDYADTGQTCPLVKMYTLGNGFLPSPDHAGGLSRHEPRRVEAEARRIPGGHRRQADRRLRSSRGIRPPGDHPARPRERARHPGRHERGEEVRRNRRGEDDPVRPDRHRVLRHVRLRRAPQRRNGRPRAFRRGAGSGLRQHSQHSRRAVKHARRAIGTHPTARLKRRVARRGARLWRVPKANVPTRPRRCAYTTESIAAFSVSMSTGLGTCSFMPQLNERLRSSGKASDVTAMMGIDAKRSSSSARMRIVAS